eukprot:1140087-Amphidinium_carterae.1
MHVRYLLSLQIKLPDSLLINHTTVCPQAADTTHASETWAVQDAFPHRTNQHQAHKVSLK